MRTKVLITIAAVGLFVVFVPGVLPPIQHGAVAAELRNDPALSGLDLSLADPEGKISRDAALEVVSREFGDMFDVSQADAYLVTVTDPATMRGATPIDTRALWLIRFTNLAIPAPAPITADGSSALARPYATGYVYVDAVTGEWLLTRLEN